MATILHAIVGYFVLLLVVRVLRRRAGSQMTMFDFVLIFLMGGIVILATVGRDRSVTNCTCGVIAVGMLHRGVSWAKSKSDVLGRIVDGTPLVVIKNGEWQPEVVRGMHLRQEDVEAAARSSGITSVEKIDFAVLERNGRISVIEKEK